MVPKIISTSRKRFSSKDNVRFDGESESEAEVSDESKQSSNESLQFDSGDDFFEAVSESATNKRKLQQVEDDSSTNEIEPVETEGQAPAKKKKKKKKTTDVDIKPPTAEEMIRLRETENLFHSNLFRMQIDEMIKEVKPRKMERKQIKPWLEDLKEVLLNIDDSNETLLNDSCYVEEIKSPLPSILKDEKFKSSTKFLKPESVSVTGSFPAGCCLGPSLSVDVLVVIPKKCFLKEDYLNVRYHRKRAAYLGCVATSLRASQLIDQQQGIRWSVGGTRLSPRLVMYPAGPRLNKVQVTVSAVPQSDAFKLSRFTPAKNNLREGWLTSRVLKDCRTSTPIYNTTVMRDLVMLTNESLRCQVLGNNDNLKDAIALLRVWLKQRGLESGPGGFNGYLTSMLVVALSMSRRLNSLMSSYQIVRNVWLFLSQSDWTKDGFTMCSTKQEVNAPSLEDFQRHFDVVFVDSTGYCNLAADVHRLTYLKVKDEAVLAVQWLDNPNMNSFQALFMTPLPFLRQFDHIICITKSKNTVGNLVKKECSWEARVNHFFDEDRLFTDVITGILRQGLEGRLDQLMHQLPPKAEWPVSETPPVCRHSLLIGLRLNPDTAYSVVEKGPPANEPQAAEFRSLWGSRCELRRFRDGTVCEAVVWAEPSAPLATRRMITAQMARALLHQRLSLPKQSVKYLADQLEPLVVEKAYIPDKFEYGAGEEANQAVVKAFDQLAKQLRELPDLPLDVSSVQGVSAVFRGAEVFPPLGCAGRPQVKSGIEAKTSWLLIETLGKTPIYISPVEGVMQLGLSRKWPEDAEAVRRIRAAFNLHIAKALLEQYDLQTQAFPDHVDVFKEGFVFRIHVVYPREVVLLKETTTPDGKLCYRDTPESLALEKYISHLPKLTGALHGLQQQWPGYSVVCRLAKRWLSAQLLDSSHMPEVATELLVASLFLSPEPFRPLAQPQPMFLRFLHLLAHSNWQLEPLIVNFNGDLRREDLVEMESHFRTERTSLPPLCIMTQYDRTGSVWTREAPLLPVLLRVASLATESLSILKNNLTSNALLEECKVVFRPPLELYDIRITLKPLVLPRIIHQIDFSTKTPHQCKVPQLRKKIPITGFDPAQCYLRELRDSYSDYALFFHDTYGGTTIGVLFKPSAFEKQEFKVSHVNCRKPVQEGKKTLLTLNLDAIIEDFYILGAGLVKIIDLSPKYSAKM